MFYEKAANYLAGELSQEPSSPQSKNDIQLKRMGFYVSSISESFGNESNSLNLSSKPISSQSLARLQSSTSSSDLSLDRLGVVMEAKSHNKSHSFDSSFTHNHSFALGTAESWQNELSEITRQMGNDRPKNPITARWDPDSYFRGVKPDPRGDGSYIANDPQAAFSLPHSSRPKGTGTAGQQSLSGHESSGANPRVTRPAITFSEILDTSPAIRRKILICGDVFCGKTSLVS